MAFDFQPVQIKGGTGAPPGTQSFDFQPVQTGMPDTSSANPSFLGSLFEKVGETGQSVGRGMVAPFVKLTNSIGSAGAQAIGLSQELLGDKTGSDETFRKVRAAEENMPQDISPFRGAGTPTDILKAAGTGAQIGAMTAPVGGLESTFAKGIGTLIPRLAGAGADILAGPAAGFIPGYIYDVGQKASEGKVDLRPGPASALGTITGAVGSIATAKLTPATSVLRSEAVSNLDKAIGFGGKMSPEAMYNISQKRLQGLGVLADNAPNITVLDKNGIDKTFDHTNTTIAETAQALPQAKRLVWEKVNKLMTEAGQKGVKVNTRQAIDGLDEIINSKRPSSIRDYAIQVRKDLTETIKGPRGGEVTIPANFEVKDAQQFMQDFNTRLGSFFKGSSDALHAQVDAMVVAKLGEQMDTSIEQAIPESSRDLKAQYGSLKSLEGDLTNRARQLARRTGSGLDSYINPWSYAEVITGLVTGHPGLALKGGIQIGSRIFLKSLNSPERFLQKAFNAVEQLRNPSPTSPGFFRKTGSPGDALQGAPGAMIQDVKNLKQTITETPNRQGGFARIPSSEYAPFGNKPIPLTEYMPQDQKLVSQLKDILQKQNSPDRLRLSGDRASSVAKGNAMEMSATLRQLRGDPTPTEIRNAQRYLSSNFVGKSIEVNGQKGIVIGNSFGRSKVSFEDGTIKYVTSDEITEKKITVEDSINHLREEARKKGEGLIRLYGQLDEK